MVRGPEACNRPSLPVSSKRAIMIGLIVRFHFCNSSLSSRWLALDSQSQWGVPTKSRLWLGARTGLERKWVPPVGMDISCERRDGQTQMSPTTPTRHSGQRTLVTMPIPIGQTHYHMAAASLMHGTGGPTTLEYAKIVMTDCDGATRPRGRSLPKISPSSFHCRHSSQQTGGA